MANLDTPAKRHSGLLWGLPWRTLPFPDGTVAQGDRQAVARMYSGILASPAVVTYPVWEFDIVAMPVVEVTSMPMMTVVSKPFAELA